VQHPFWRKHVPVTNAASYDVFTAQNLIFENEGASVHDPGYHALAQTGWAGWFHDETTDISLDFLKRTLPCTQHKIALSDVTFATNLFLIGEQAVAVAQPDMFEFVEYYEAPHFDDFLVEKFTGKNFLILPISDGFSSSM
jgi:hypothetical protein